MSCEGSRLQSGGLTLLLVSLSADSDDRDSASTKIRITHKKCKPEIVDSATPLPIDVDDQFADSQRSITFALGFVEEEFRMKG